MLPGPSQAWARGAGGRLVFLFVEFCFRSWGQCWCRAAEACVHWHNHVDQIYNLIRGCDPSPGAWTQFRGRKLHLFDARKESARTYSPGAGAVGTIVAIGERGFRVAAHGGCIEIGKVREDAGKKMSAAQFCAQNDLNVGSVLHV